MKLIFVIPVFNELANIPHLIDSIKQHYPMAEIVFSDDGSGDGTEVYFDQKIDQCTYLRNEVNEGPGAAFNLAMIDLHRLDQLNNALIITLEGDQTSKLNDLPLMIEKAGNENTILASVYLTHSSIRNVGFIKKVASKIVQSIIKSKYQLPYLTYSSFYRVYQGKHIASLIEKYGVFCTEKGFVSQLEVLLKLHHLKCNLIEIPTEVLSHKREGESKMKILKTTWEYLRFMVRFRFSN